MALSAERANANKTEALVFVFTGALGKRCSDRDQLSMALACGTPAPDAAFLLQLGGHGRKDVVPIPVLNFVCLVFGIGHARLHVPIYFVLLAWGPKHGRIASSILFWA